MKYSSSFKTAGYARINMALFQSVHSLVREVRERKKSLHPLCGKFYYIWGHSWSCDVC